MGRFFPLLAWMWGAIFAIIVVGPAGAFVYDLLRDKHSLEVLWDLFQHYWPWVVSGFTAFVGVTGWSYATLGEVVAREKNVAAKLLESYLQEIRSAFEFATFDLHGRKVGDEADGVPYLPLRVGQVVSRKEGRPEAIARNDERSMPPIHDFHRPDSLGLGTTVREVPVDSLLETPGRRVIRGGAGSGKSTLIRWLARREANQRGRAALLVDVSSWAESRKPFLQYWAEHWFSAIRGRLSSPGDVEQVDQLIAAARQWLADERAYIVLDGLDEVSERHLHGSAVDQSLRTWQGWLARPVDTEGITILVTSRFGSWLTLTEPKLSEEMELLPLRPQDTQAYLERFFAWKRSTGEAARLSLELEQALRRDPVMSKMVGNPFFLELVAFVFEKEGLKLPYQLPLVIDRAIRALLEQSPQRGDVPSYMDPAPVQGLPVVRG